MSIRNISWPAYAMLAISVAMGFAAGHTGWTPLVWLSGCAFGAAVMAALADMLIAIMHRAMGPRF